jgi:uroporphyrinogen III methyltransferase / synthase
MNKPCVYIVGAGPGDPSLISVRGRRYLERADVVVHDHRVSAATLRLARPDAEKIDVGPAAPRTLDQEAISILLAEKVREGKSVVRLKLGDPFVFDSGGKEALLLHEQGIAYDIVPGIPTVIAGMAYAGIPVTYPGAGDVVTLIRGNEGETDAAPEVDWARLAGMGGTIACYAGPRQIHDIAHALVAHGRSAEESSALVYRATTAAQRTITATLGEIASQALDGEPALLVVGAVVGLRDHLRWFDNRPLFGRRIVVTRSREQGEDLTEMLEARGAEAIAAPMIRIEPPQDIGALEEACATAGSFDWIVFTSANAVESFMSKLLETGDVRDLKGVRLCAVGPSTASKIQRFGVRVDAVPAEHHAEGVLQALAAAGPIKGQRYLLPRSDIAREVLGDELRRAGAQVTEVVAYRTITAPLERDSDHDIYRMLLERQIDAVTFTSASTVRNFVQIYGEDQAVDLLNTTVVACIGPVTAEAAQQLGIQTAVVPERYTVPDLIDALVEYFRGKGEPR